jgi:uncharacterized protein YndB with AHSA1/START domain
METDRTDRSEDGSLQEVDGRYVLRFRRRYTQDPERVWAALTRPEQLKQWLGATEIEIDLRPGGKMRIRTSEPPELVQAIIAEAGEEALVSEDTVLRVEAPRVFEHTFAGDSNSIVRWELRPDGDGCELLLSHMEPQGLPSEDAPRDLAGWHMLLDLLAQLLESRPGTWSLQEWEAQRERYRRSLADAG